MTFKLEATITHRSFGEPIVHVFYYTGEDLESILRQIDTLPQHIKNLKHHRKTAFKDVNGVRHVWKLTHCEEMN